MSAIRSDYRIEKEAQDHSLQRFEAQESELQALRSLVERRRSELFVSEDEMRNRLTALVDRKRRLHDVTD